MRKWMDTQGKPAYDAECAAVSLPSREAVRPRSQFMEQAAMQEEKSDLTSMVADLNSLLRLKTTVIGMKMFARVEEMAAIPKIRRPSAVHTTDQIVSMASRLGWQVGSTAAELVAAPRRAAMCG